MIWIQLDKNVITHVVDTPTDPNDNEELKSDISWTLPPEYLSEYVKPGDELLVFSSETDKDGNKVEYFTIKPENDEEFTNRLLDYLKERRKIAQSSFIKYNNNEYGIDESTKTEITRRLAQMKDDETINWKSETGYVTLTKNDLFSINNAITVHTQNIFDNEMLISNSILSDNNQVNSNNKPVKLVNFINNLSFANWYQFSSENYDFYNEVEIIANATGNSSGENDVPDEFKPIPAKKK